MKKDFKEFKEFIKGKKTAVVGIGVSNKPLIKYLVSLGAAVTGFDKKTEGQLGNDAEELKKLGVNLELGEGYLDKLTGFDVVFKTPSMRIDSEALGRAKDEGSYVTSEMEEFVRYCPAKVYGVTGSDGKTTTTSLIYAILKEHGYETWVGGNIGTPLFSKIEEIRPDHKVVLELSSFQLMTMNLPMDVAIVTNLSPNHLDMHKNMDEYISSKKNVFKYQTENDILILNKDNDITSSFVNEAKGKVRMFSRRERIQEGSYFRNDKLYVFGEEVCSKDDIVIKGMHNVENYLAAFAATYDDVSIAEMKKVAMTFAGVEHRNEFVREFEGVKYYNDSIASSPTRTLAGLKAAEKPVILIAGGYDKNIPFEPLAYEGYDKIKALVLIGATKDKISAAFAKLRKEKGIEVNIFITDTLEEAVNKARGMASQGDIITLSPACASFDMFPNFEARGNTFKEIVNNLK